MTETHMLTIIGLGPGEIDQLTIEALSVLEAADTVYLRTERHPAVPALRKRFPSLEIRSFDAVYESQPTFEDVYAAIVAELMDHLRARDVVYCVPGSPVVDETTVELLRKLADVERVPIRLIHGLSYLEPVMACVEGASRSWTTVVDAIEIDLITSEDALGAIPGRPGRLAKRGVVPTAPLLVSQVYDAHIAASLKLWLSASWPEEHEVSVITAAGTRSQSVERIPIHRLDRVEFDHLTSVYVPPIDPIEDVRTFTGLLNVTQTLRAPGGCPWDREQTHDTLKPHLLEETYEVIEALDEHDYEKLCGELGDLLFQVTIHSQVAAEAGEFDISDVIAGITRKLIRRHPHVFADVSLTTSSAVLERWESMKQEETPDRPSVLSTIPLATPALPYSYAVQKRAANQGFEWPDIESVLGKVDEELGELRDAVGNGERRGRVGEELGDLLFTLVSVGRWLKVEPEETLRRANRKFVQRFQYIEKACKENGKVLRKLSAEELDTLWDEAKAQAT